MAFPTSSLTNNQVHKEGNRSFVYDSSLGVWDQVRETDSTENKIQTGTIGSGVTFPAGHVRQVKQGSFGGLAQTSSASNFPNKIQFDSPILSTSHVLIDYYFVYITRSSTAQGTSAWGQFWLTGSNFGDTTSGYRLIHYLAYYESTFHCRYPVSGNVLDTNPKQIPIYGLYVSGAGGTFEVNVNEQPQGATLFEIIR